MTIAEALTGRKPNNKDEIIINDTEVPYQLLVKLNLHTSFFHNLYNEEKNEAKTILTFADDSSVHIIINLKF